MTRIECETFVNTIFKPTKWWIHITNQRLTSFIVMLSSEGFGCEICKLHQNKNRKIAYIINGYNLTIVPVGVRLVGKSQKIINFK